MFSTNIIIPSFHTMAGKRMEVYDTASDLTVADFDNNRMINLQHIAREDRFETFPCFSADGDGNPSKPFVLPQKSAVFYEYNLKSFNVPDIGKTRTEITLKDIDRLYKAESEAFE